MTSDVVSAEEKTTRPARTSSAQEQLAAAMVAQAQEQGLALTGPHGLLKQLMSDAVGEVEVAVPRDREGSFNPVIACYQRDVRYTG